MPLGAPTHDFLEQLLETLPDLRRKHSQCNPAFASGSSILQGLALDRTLSSYYLPSLMAHQARMVDKLLRLDSQALSVIAIDIR